MVITPPQLNDGMALSCRLMDNVLQASVHCKRAPQETPQRSSGDKLIDGSEQGEWSIA